MNLIELLKNEVSDKVISSLSQKAGVSEDQVKTGFSAGIPAILAGILKNGAGGNSGFLGNIMSGITGSSPDNNPTDLLNGSEDSLLEKGKSLLGGLFGNETNAVTNSLSSSTGLSPEKSTGLLAMIAPLVTGFISKIMASNGWNFKDLLGKIFESKADITAALPQGLGDSLGLANIKMPEVNIPKVEIPKAPPLKYGTVQEPKSGGGLLKWLIPILIVLIAAWWLMSRSGCNETKMEGMTDTLSTRVDSIGSSIEAIGSRIDSSLGKLNEAGDFVRDLGATISKKLPDGAEISIAENSIENKLISFIEDKDKPVDKTTWFTFDRLYFETGKTTLKPESQDQLKNMAAILKAYPNVHLKMGGYTDNTGDASLNKTLSNDRANAAMQELVKLGIDANRLSAEGYGPEHPIASNDTPEGRAKNRRIDVRVSQK
jgi:OOP family OmpA-OmpF porin